MSEADYIVVRIDPAIPKPWPPNTDGWWFDRGWIPEGHSPAGFWTEDHVYVAVPTDRFETREDGAVAQVWEVQP